MTKASSSRVARLATSPQRILPPEGKPFKLRLGGALQDREEGLIGIDGIKTDSVDYVVDLKSFPWPIDDGVVDFIFAAYYYQKLTEAERHAFMNECWRVLKMGSQMSLLVPNWASGRCLTFPGSRWPPVGVDSFLRYSKDFRDGDRNRAPSDVTCHFTWGYGQVFDPDIQVRNDDYRTMSAKHYINAVHDIQVTLSKAAL